MEIKQHWLEIFKNEYFDLLNPNNVVKKKGKMISPSDRGVIDNLWQRGDGFLCIFNLLLENKTSNFNIVETGTLRNINSWSDGQSALIFTKFVDTVDGNVQSVDIDLNAVKTSNSYINNKKFQSFHSDSVKWLKELPNKENIDLFYLDSYDCKWGNDVASATHHLAEFKVIEPYLNNTIVAIDDNTRLINNNTRVGKGRMIYEYLLDKGIKPIYDNYQIIYKF